MKTRLDEWLNENSPEDLIPGWYHVIFPLGGQKHKVTTKRVYECNKKKGCPPELWRYREAFSDGRNDLGCIYEVNVLQWGPVQKNKYGRKHQARKYHALFVGPMPVFDRGNSIKLSIKDTQKSQQIATRQMVELEVY